MSGLVHLNGRVYDPLLARFTSADPTVTDPMKGAGLETVLFYVSEWVFVVLQLLL